MKHHPRKLVELRGYESPIGSCALCEKRASVVVKIGSAGWRRMCDEHARWAFSAYTYVRTDKVGANERA